MTQVKLADGRMVRLGRRRPKAIFDHGKFRFILTHDDRLKVVLHLGNYYAKELDATPPPAQTSWRTKGATALAEMYLNDTEGDCVIASKYHILGCVSGNETSPILATNAEVQGSYTGICGPGDNGCVITDVLDYWKATGLVATGQKYKIDNYVAFDWTNQTLLQVGLEVFGPAACIGINLPNNWTCSDCVWGPPSGGVVGGHDVCVIDYTTVPDPAYQNLTGVYIGTWASVCLIPWAQFLASGGQYIEEAYFALSPQWYNQGNLAPNGIDAATLASDLAMLGSGTVPPLGPVPPGPGPNPGPGPVTSGVMTYTPNSDGSYTYSGPPLVPTGGVVFQAATVAAIEADLAGKPKPKAPCGCK